MNAAPFAKKVEALRTTLLTAGAASRLGAAIAILVLMWLAVWWAIR